MLQRSIIIGISGQTGTGKSTVATALAQRRDDITILDIDVYEWAGVAEFPLYRSRDVKQAVADWAARGGDADEYVQIPRLADDLASLREGREVRIHKATGEPRVIQSAKVVLFISHFGRGYRAVADLVDLQFHLEVPLDISLARALSRRARDNPGFDVRPMLDAYLSIERIIWEQMRLSGKDADVVLGGRRSVDELVELAEKAIAKGMA